MGDARFAELLKPIKDLTQNWQVKIFRFIAPQNDSGGVLVFECKWVTMERERNGLLWSESVMGYYGACMMGYYGLMVYGSYDQVAIQAAM